MRRLFVILTLGVAAALGTAVIAQQQAAPAEPVPADLPDWAYGPPPPPGSPPPPTALPTDDKAILRVPGSKVELTRADMRNVAGKPIPEWHPEDRRGTKPDIVNLGRQGITACGLCHVADGSGRPENASVSGLPVLYFIRQMEDFKTGLRDSADPRKANTNLMINFAKLATPEEVRAAAEYFAAQPYPKRIKVIEAKMAPRVRRQGGMDMAIPAAEGGGMEPMRDHIVEVPDDNLRAEVRDSRLGFTAYVPTGSLNSGKKLAATHQCAVCHGAHLEGIGPVPALAGRSPSYTMRQLFDMKQGTRKGPWVALMKPLVEKMSVKEMLQLSAYVGSLDPPPAPGTRATH